MKIVHVISYFQPKLGYQEYYLAKEQQKQGHDVTVITSDRYFPFPNYKDSFGKLLGNRILKPGFFIEEGIKTIRLKVRFENGTILWLKNLKKTILKENPDIVFLHQLFSINTMLLIKFLNKHNVKIIVDEHLLPYQIQDARNFRDRLIQIALKMSKNIIKRKLNYVDLFFTVTPSLTNFLKEYFNHQNIETIPLGVDPELFNSKANLDKIDELEGNFFTLGYSGKIIENKGLEKLFSISNKLMNEYSNLRLVLVGNGSENYIKRLIKIIDEKNRSRIKIIGAVPHNILQNYIQYFNLSFWLGSVPSASMEENMIMGIPIAISEKTTKSYLITQDSGCFLYTNNDEELEAWIKENIENKSFYEKNSRKSRNFILANFTWEKINEKIFNLIDIV